MLIAHVDLSEDDLSTLTTRYGDIITSHKGVLVKIERWGKRKLAYLIRKQGRGFYILIDYAGDSSAVNELERNLKIDDRILKFMTVLKADAVDLAALEKEIADALAKEATASAPSSPPAASAETELPAAADSAMPAPGETNVKGEE